MNEEDDEDGDELGPTQEEMTLMRQVSVDATAAIDDLLLGQCGERWIKVANLIGRSLDEFERLVTEQPYVLMQMRLLDLEQQGRVDISGNVMRIRESEVRLSRRADEAQYVAQPGAPTAGH